MEPRYIAMQYIVKKTKHSARFDWNKLIPMLHKNDKLHFIDYAFSFEGRREDDRLRIPEKPAVFYPIVRKVGLDGEILFCLFKTVIHHGNNIIMKAFMPCDVSSHCLFCTLPGK